MSSSSSNSRLSGRDNAVRQGRGINSLRCIKLWNELGRGPKCSCGVEGVILTSSTDENPCRRFMTCGRIRQGNGCATWAWIDPPTCQTGIEFFCLLKDELLLLKNENTALKRQLQMQIGVVKADNGEGNRVGGRKNGWGVVVIVITIVVSLLVKLCL